MTADDDHSGLVAAWVELREVMDRLPQRLQWGDVQHMDVTDMADRVRGLAIHLDSAVELAGRFRYESALALLRTGLEQCVLDWLVFQGRTLVQRYNGVDDEKWREWQAARASGADWTRTIKNWMRTRKGEVRIVREGLHSEPDEAGNTRQVSIYYFLLEQYRPTLGPPSAQTADWSISADELRRMARDNQALWHVYLTWSAMLTNLQENQLVDEVDAGRLAAHYRFLSGFAHPVVDHRRETYGHDALMGWPKYNHYSGELVLLYAITFGVLELKNFIVSLEARPSPSLANVGDVKQMVEAAESAASYFWFLGARPHPYDIWKARNEIAFQAMRDTGVGDHLPPEPAPEDVPYPSDPLRRLVALHGSAREMMTGLGYVSSWPRHDARFR